MYERGETPENWEANATFGQLGADDSRVQRLVMPIMIGSMGKHKESIPFSLLNEQQAHENHGQTLKRLAERGGLAPCEALAIIYGRRWKHMDEQTSLRKLLAIIETVKA